jgi:hypothetical protein
MSFALEEAEVVSLVLECCFFGIFTALFLTTLWVLVNKSSTGRTSWPLVLIVCSMYLLAITNLSIDVYRAIHAFASIGRADVTHKYLLFHGKYNYATEVAKSAVYSVQTVLADGFFVWRCYIVWNKCWYIIVLPIIMVLGDMASAAGLCWTFSKATHGRVFNDSALGPWITATFSMTLATNVVCSALIVYRLWRSQRLMEPGRNNFKLLPVMVMVIESGAIYSSALVCVVVTYTSRNNEQYIILDFLPSLMGIVFTLIVLRVGLGISSNGNAPLQSQKARTISDFSFSPSHEDASGNYSTKPMAFPASVGGVNHSDVESGIQYERTLSRGGSAL